MRCGIISRQKALERTASPSTENTILVFRGSDDQKRTVLLVLRRVSASARSEQKQEPRPPPLNLELSYIEDPGHPDIFRIGKGQF